MVTNFMSQDLEGESLQTKLVDLAQTDHDRVIHQANHGKAATQSRFAFVPQSHAPSRLVQLNEMAPHLQRRGPGSLPLRTKRIECIAFH